MKTVLLIDDDPIFNFINTKIIETVHFADEVKTFTSGSLAIHEMKKLAESSTQNCGYTVFLDLNMPGMDGWQFMDEVNRLPEEVGKIFNIFILSSSVDAYDIEKSKCYKNVRKFISKPLTVFHLQEITAEAC